MANSPGYTLLDGNLLREVINPETRTNAFMLITPHGEIIHDSRPVRNVPVLAMCYSGVPLTVNYSDNDENDRVLGIVDDNLHSTLRNKSFESSSTKPSSRDPSKATLSKAAEFLAAKAGHDNPHHFKKITEFLCEEFDSSFNALNVEPPMGANCKTFFLSLLSRKSTVLLQSKHSSSKKIIPF
jgi:hypothetical protein